LTSRQALYVCHTKTLQDQLLKDVPYAKVLKGRSNYPTLDAPEDFPEVSCGDCDKHAWGDCPICKRLPVPPHDDGQWPQHCTCCAQVEQCPYECAKAAALAAPLAVVNYAYFLAEANNVHRLSGWPLMILDEADVLEDVLMDFVSVTFSVRTMRELGLTPPTFKGTTDNAGRKAEEWGGWLATEVRPRIQAQVETMKREADNYLRLKRLDDYRRARRRLNHYQRLDQSVALMLADLLERPESWVRVDDGDNLTFKPVHVGKYAHGVLWRHADRFLCMSATIISHSQFCSDLGLDPAQVAWIDVPCMFPAANRLVIYLPAASVTHKAMKANGAVQAQAKAQAQTQAQADPPALRLLAAAVDRILAAYPSSRVLVHCHTFAIARYLLQACQNRARMVSYRQGDAHSRADAIERYRLVPNAVLVAPSLERGVDFRDDLCRCQIICKVPYPSLGDRQVSRRFHSGRDGRAWYYTQTARALVQMAGRGVRTENDWCHTYILDAEFGSFLRRNRQLLPAWWRDALVLNGTILGEEVRTAR
jgi:ATP-dependent DNA helicase DinG